MYKLRDWGEGLQSEGSGSNNREEGLKAGRLFQINSKAGRDRGRGSKFVEGQPLSKCMPSPVKMAGPV